MRRAIDCRRFPERTPCSLPTLCWYLSEVQEGLKSGDWEKADEVIGMIHTYQQAKNKTVDIRPEKIQAEIKYNQMDVFRQCKKGT